MANSSENIVYKITVDTELGVATVRNLKGQIVATKVPVKELRKEFGNFAKTVDSVKFDKFKKGLDTATKSNQNLRTASGAATSSVMELGRVISDAPYGIRGMANNITQLVSQMGFAVKTSGSLTLALKDMWRALMGPLGIVLAITAAVSALDFFAGGQKKSEKATDKNTESLKKQITPLNKLLNLYSSLKKVLFTSKDNEAINAFNNNFLSLDETVKVLTRNFSEFKNAYDKLTEPQKKDKDAVKALVEGYSELLELREAEEKQVSRMSVLRADIDKKGRTISRNGLTRLREEAKELDTLENTYIKTQKRLIQLEEYFSKVSKTSRDPKTRPKAFQVVTPDSIEKQVKFGKKLIKAVAKSMNIELGKKPIDINKALDFKLSDETIEAIKKYNEEVAGQMALEDKLSETQEGIEKSKKILGTMTDFMNAQFDREMTIEANKTNALNAELNNRLLNENLSKEERAKIQNQIAINDEKLRKKQEKIAKKQFNMNKAANIATALMDTSAAAIGVMKDAKGGFFARLAQALPTIAFGLAQVATISRQKFQTSAAKTPIRTSTGGIDGGASGGRTAPVFNVVGMSNGNQLVETIQTQFSKPLKAYVVSRDVTTQQQLDGMIVGQAGT
jgi:hypothetical protein